jgi:hypothetical protein
MSQNISLKELERKAWRSVFQDGLWDIYLGLLLMAMAVGAWMSDRGVPKVLHSAIYIGLMMLSMLVLWVGKRFITLPRMGHVKFGPKRKRARNKVRVILALSALVGVASLFLTIEMEGNPNLAALLNPRVLLPAAWVVNALLVFGLGAYFLDFDRLYVIGALYAVAIPLDILLSKYTGMTMTAPVAIGVPAAIVLVMGTVVFTRFLRDYPLVAQEAAAGNG